MKKPILSDYSTTGNMTNPYGSYDYEKYSVDMKIYAEYLESKLSEPTTKEETSKEKLNIPDVVKRLIADENKCMHGYDTKENRSYMFNTKKGWYIAVNQIKRTLKEDFGIIID